MKECKRSFEFVMCKDLPLFLFDIVNIISFINFVDQQVVLNHMDQKDIVKSGKTVKDVNIKAYS